MSSDCKEISADAARMLKEAAESPVAFLKIKQAYDFGDPDEVIIVIEGADDELFYRKLVKQILDVGNLVVARAGNKKQVRETYEALDWSMYKRERILFFVDRDYDEIISGTPFRPARNVYVTDCYAIENYVFTEESFLRLCSYACGNAALTEDDEHFIRSLYMDASSVFETALSNVPESLVAWRMSGLKPNQGNIKLKEILKFDEGVATQKVGDAIAVIARRCGIPESRVYVSDSELLDIGERLRCYGDFCSKMSGKVVMQFFKMLSASMVGYCFPSGAKISRNQLLAPEVFPICVSLTDCPPSLKEFLMEIKKRLSSARAS